VSSVEACLPMKAEEMLLRAVVVGLSQGAEELTLPSVRAALGGVRKSLCQANVRLQVIPT
jgi:hypothetical protein